MIEKSLLRCCSGHFELLAVSWRLPMGLELVEHADAARAIGLDVGQACVHVDALAQGVALFEADRVGLGNLDTRHIDVFAAKAALEAAYLVQRHGHAQPMAVSPEPYPTGDLVELLERSGRLAIPSFSNSTPMNTKNLSTLHS